MRRLTEWLPRLSFPVRSGEHGQTAFALGLALDAARAAGDLEAQLLIGARAMELYASDQAAPIDYEPSGQDFLSPALGEADLMRRVLDAKAFAGWLERFLPDLGSDRARRWLTSVETADRSDGKLAHLDGLNLSRAWMLDGIATALAEADLRVPELRAAMRRHLEAGVRAAREPTHDAGTHWLGSFAMYALTRRGAAAPIPAGTPGPGPAAGA